MTDKLKAFVPLLLARNQSPDFIQDHGHTFGAQLPDVPEASAHRVHEDVLTTETNDGQRRYLPAPAVSQSNGQEPAVPVQHLGPLR